MDGLPNLADIGMFPFKFIDFERYMMFNLFKGL